MEKAYTRVNWENYTSTATPLNAANLNNMDRGIDEIDDRVLNLDSGKVSAPALAGTKGQVLALDDRGKTIWKDDEGVKDYNELDNIPSINNVDLKGKLSLDDLGIPSAGDYIKYSIASNVNTSTPTQIYRIVPATEGDRPPMGYPFGILICWEDNVQYGYTDQGQFVRFKDESAIIGWTKWEKLVYESDVNGYKNIVNGNLFDLETTKASVFSGHFSDGIAGGTGVVLCYGNSYLMVSDSAVAVYDKTTSNWKSLVDSSTIEDNLTSTSTTHPLSANQGKVLDDKITALTTLVGNVNAMLEEV